MLIPSEQDGKIQAYLYWESVQSACWILRLEIKTQAKTHMILFYGIFIQRDILSWIYMPSWLRNTSILTLTTFIEFHILKHAVPFSGKYGYFYNYWFKVLLKLVFFYLFLPIL